MKKVWILLVLCCATLAMAQEKVVEKSFAFKGQELDIDVDLGTEIAIKSWDRDEIAVKITYIVNDGENNDAVRVDLDDYKDRLSIDVEVNEREMREADYCCCDRGQGMIWKKNGRRGSCVEMLVEVSSPASADVRVKSVISNVVIKGMKGNVEVETVTGGIELNWDVNTGAEVTLNTTTGDLYTNIDMDRKKDRGLKVISSHKVRGRLKNGEKEIFLKTVTSDIYFRKSGT